MNRRTFFIGSSALIGLSAVGVAGFHYSQKKSGKLIGGVQVGSRKSTRDFLLIRDLESGDQKEIDLGFWAHSVASHPTNSDLCVAIGKKSPSLLFFDSAKGTQIAEVTAPKDRLFYGHGVFDQELDLLYVTAFELVEDKKHLLFDFKNHFESKTAGYILIINTKTFDVVGEISSYGHSPHDIVSPDGGKTLIVTNEGYWPKERSALAVIDSRSKGLLKIIDGYESEERLEFDHLALSPKRSMLFVEGNIWRNEKALASKLFAVDLSTHEIRKAHIPESIEQEVRNELLSLCFDSQGKTLAVTCPLHHVVIFIDATSGKFIKKLNLKFPTGVALSMDGEHFVFSAHGQLKFVNANTLAVDESKTQVSFKDPSEDFLFMAHSKMI